MKFTHYNSLEKGIIKEKFNTIPYMDVWISSIVEGYIYENIIKVDKYGYREEYIERYRKKEGEYKKWHPNGQLNAQGYYKEGKEEGEFKEWYYTGQLSSQKYYKKGKFEGEYKSWWWTNGQSCVQCYYKEGVIEGEYKSWYSNGQLWVQWYYKEGKKEGESKRWDDQGNLISHKIYTGGEVIEDLQRTLGPPLPTQ